jgi:3-hydroxy-9,10-secoandrosta-1,3,5(10)-triene-9,17-dione monooxygenase reductase component
VSRPGTLLPGAAVSEPALPAEKAVGVCTDLAGELEPGALRQVLGQFVTGVTIVTGMAGDRPVGMTVNSFTSVSLAPPLVLFCAASGSMTGRHILKSGAFAVNILGRDQQEVAERFAARVEGRFAGLPARAGRTGSPILTDGLAFLDCRIADRMVRGDHFLILGEVVEAGILRTGEPLAFFDRSYR